VTPLAKRVQRRGTLPVFGRTLAVTLYPGDVIGVRQSGTRKEYTLPLSWVYSLAVKTEVLRAKAERAALKKARARK
jgi:hypothetical protein